jgi:hypothetical protein
MKLMKSHYKLLLVLIAVVFASCQDLTELNVNPNGVDPSTVNPNLLVTTVITGTAQPYLSNGYNGNLAGVMQYIQQDGWSSGTNNFDWTGESSWSGYYSTLRNVMHLKDRAEAEGMEFQQGLALVLKAFNFGVITDGWGDAPYTDALNAPNGEQQDLFPAFDSQETVYKAIIEDLKMANTMLSQQMGSYVGINQEADVMYNGNPAKWRKLANSLMLRYYMRVSSKLPDYAKAGIEEIVSNPDTYPIFTSNDDDATMNYVGTSNDDSWPANTTYDNSESNFSRIQLCAGLRDVLVDYNDPRLPVWFNKVKVKITISDAHAADGGDVTVDGVRYLTPANVAQQGYAVYDKNTWQQASADGTTIIDTMEYVGIPTAVVGYEPYNYNLNPNPTQGGYNQHVSELDAKYKDAEGPMLKARLMSYAEVCFILSEAAQKGWSVGSQQTWYEKGVQASLVTWGVGDDYSTYMATSGVAYDGSLSQLLTQKWIANWTNATEAWCDWRRTGLPNVKFGARGRRDAMPIRYRYDANEKNRNATNYATAISGLEQTGFTAEDGNDSAWSKMWLLQGTGKPY